MPLPTVWGFLLLCVTQGSGENWQKPASLVVPTPALHPISVRRQSRQRLSEFFLAAQRRTASTVKKKLPKGTPWKGFLWTPPETEGPRSLWHPGAARYRDFPSRALLRTFERSIVGSTTNLEDPTWRKANFLWKFLCAGGASLDYGGDPIPTAVPPQGFLQNKNALRRRRLPNLLLGSLIVVRTANRFAIADQSESAGKNRRSLPQGLDTSCLEPMGSHKGPQTLVYLRASVK